MKHTLKALTAASLMATAQLSGVAFARDTTGSATPIASTASAATTREPQQHFVDVVDAMAKRDYKAAATEIRRAADYMRREAGRATGDARLEIDRSVTELDRLAYAVEKGAVRDEKSVDGVFARADHALALTDRARAVQSWTHREYAEAGDELKRAGYELKSAAGWAGTKATVGASAVAAGTEALGDKLATGASWTRAEVARGFDALGRELDQLGHEIGGKHSNEPARSGA